MATNLLSYDQADDDYIDMEVSSFSHLLCNSNSSSQPTEFEFQMNSLSLEKELITSPADELFYKGKLLPLHLPPRLQMVEKLLQHSKSTFSSRTDHNFEEFYSTPLMATPTASNTPFESCNISPSESCQVSREINPEEYFFDYSNEVSDEFNQKTSWTRKLKLINQATIGSKLKASRAYLRSLFGKSGGCSIDSCTAATTVPDEGTISKAKEPFRKCEKPPQKKASFGQIHKEKVNPIPNFSSQKMAEDGNGRLHRRSLSVALRRNSTNKSATSSFSSSSSSSSSISSTNINGFYGLPFLKRSSSVNSEVENPIQGAIAHCKQSQAAAEVGFYPLSASKFGICEEQELCRG